MATDPHQQLLPVVCPLCRTRMYARLDQVGQSLRCPDCDRICPVLPPAPARAAPQRPDPGEYDLREAKAFGDPTAIRVNPVSAAPASEPSGKAPAGEGAPSSAKPSPTNPVRPKPVAIVLVTCPLCHTRMHPPAKDRGKKIACPDCGTKVVVPYQVAQRVPKPPPDLVVGQYNMGQAAATTEHPRVDMLIETQPRPTEIELPPPPRWTMFSGVFLFPLQAHARQRWLYMTMGLWVAGTVAAFAFSSLEGSFGGIVGVAALGIVVFFALAWTLLLASACLVSVTRETAAGIDVVDQWPESDWREWLWEGLILLDVGLISGGVVYLVSQLFERMPAIEPLLADMAGLVGGALVLPMLLLSIFDNGTIFPPFSWPVFRSVLLRPHYWLLFHLETLLLLAGIVSLLWLGMQQTLYLRVFVGAPLAAAYVLIYARLLGRLAWHVGELDSRDTQEEDGVD